MKIEAMVGTFRRLTAPDDQWMISYNTKGDVVIQVDKSTWYINYKQKRVVKRGDLPKSSEMTFPDSVGELERFLKRWGKEIYESISKEKSRDYDELKIFMTFLSTALNLDFPSDMIKVSGVRVTNEGFSFKR